MASPRRHRAAGHPTGAHPPPVPSFVTRRAALVTDATARTTLRHPTPRGVPHAAEKAAPGHAAAPPTRAVTTSTVLIVLALVLAACGATPGSATHTASPDQTSSAAVIPPRPATPTRRTVTVTATRGADVNVADLASAAAPPSCGAPLRQLRGYRDDGARGNGGPAGQGQVASHLQVDDGYGPGMAPVPPVLTDLTGDGGRDALLVLSCTVGDQPQPDHLVLYTAGATPLAAFNLDGIQRQRYAVVRTLRAAAGGVRVEWTAFDAPQGPVTQYEGLLRWNGKALVMNPRGPSRGRHAADVTTGAFVTTDGNIRCLVHDSVAACEAAAVTWRPPPAPPGKDCGGRPYGTALILQGGSARRACPTAATATDPATLGTALTAWHRTGWDPVVTTGTTRRAGLGPGSTMRSGTVLCRAATSAVVCTDDTTKATFTLGRTIHTLG